MNYKLRSTVTFFRAKKNHLELKQIQKKISQANYVENVNGIANLVISMEEPRGKFILYSDGRVLCMGLSNLKDAKSAHLILDKFLKKQNINYRFNKSRIKNMVLTIELDKEINLKKLNALLDNSDYEPEQFPGLVHHLLSEKNNITFLIFKSGKIVVTGVKTTKDLKMAKNYLKIISKKIK